MDCKIFDNISLPNLKSVFIKLGFNFINMDSINEANSLLRIREEKDSNLPYRLKILEEINKRC